MYPLSAYRIHKVTFDQANYKTALSAAGPRALGLPVRISGGFLPMCSSSVYLGPVDAYLVLPPRSGTTAVRSEAAPLRARVANAWDRRSPIGDSGSYSPGGIVSGNGGG